MVDTTCLKLSNLIGIDLTEVKSLEKRIQKILQGKNTDDDDENDDPDFIENKMKLLTDRRYDALKSIHRMKRMEFWNELDMQLKLLPTRCLTEAVKSRMALLKLVCYFDFTQKPLSFAFEGLHNMDILSGCENKFLELIDKLRNQYEVNNILDAQYESIRNQRRKVVLAVAGGLKAGKSSFINYLLEADTCPVGICETTARLTKIIYGQQRLVKLESVARELKEEHQIRDDEHLKEVTKRLIALEGAAREEDSCKDIVTIQLDRKELENIELWDIPGFDENPFLNSIVEDILKETNIFFILTSITEAVRETIVNLLRSCWEKHKRRPQVCFVVTKIDQVTANPKAETTLENALDHTFHRVQDRFQFKLGDEWKSSPFFIPLCTDPKYNLKDFLGSHEQFTHKLIQFFKYAVRHNTLCRLDYLIDTIHELFDYDDLNRSIERDEKLSIMLTNYLDELHTQIDKELKEPFTRIHHTVAKKISTIKFENNDTLQQVLVNEIEKEFLVQREKIDQGLSQCINELHLKLEKNLALSAVVRSLGTYRLYGDPYQAVIGQYKSGENSLLWSDGIYRASHLLRKNIMVDVILLSQKVLSYNPIGISLSSTARENIIAAFILAVCVASICALQKRTDQAQAQAQMNIKSSVEIILKSLTDDISNNIHQTLCEQLNNISEDIRRRKAKLSEQKDTSEARNISRFLKKNTSTIVQLYLNLLDKVISLEYPRCEINRNTMLGRSNFPVFAGELGDADQTYSEKIAAKRVPLTSFTWQEVRYMNELKHENILHYYGVRKSDDANDHYDILMQRLDSDLTTYIDYASKEGKINDKLMDDIFVQITRGLGYLHEQGLIHRDVKPENVLIQLKKDQAPVFVLADFGFINRVPISIKGTPGFLAPELLVNNIESTFITSKIDIFALGATIKQTLEKSRVNTNDKYVQFWMGISQRCLLDDPFQRPTCQQILEEHGHLID